MTRYNYLKEMQEFCFRAAMALAVINDDGLKDFYVAADEGFTGLLEKITGEEAEESINQSQIEQYLVTKAFVESKEKEAADVIAADTKHTEEEKDKGYLAWEEMINDNQLADDKMEAMLHQDPKEGEREATA